MAFKFITAEEAAEFIHHNDNVGFSGFTAAGTPKVVSVALAKKAEAEHAAGRPFQIGVYTGTILYCHCWQNDGICLSRMLWMKVYIPREPC